jgi:hypothetical protein
MAIETEIMLALRARLVSFAQAQSLPIAFTNKSFKTPKGGKFLRETFVPNIIDRQYLASDAPQWHRGLYQVDVMWPHDDGETAAREVAGDMAAHFATDLKLTSGTTTVRITQRPEVAGMLVDETQTMIPVTIRWEALA